MVLFDRGGPVDIGRAFSFVFDDEEWIKKVLIGAVLALTGIGLIPVIGYGLEVARRVAKGNPQPLPEWEEFGAKIIEGFLSGLVIFVWALPIILIASCTWIILVPVGVLDESGETVAIVGSILSICVSLISILYSLIMALILPAALTNYAVKGELGAAFRFSEILSLVRNNIKVYLMVLLISIVAQIIGSLGSIVICIGAYVTMFYSVLVTYYTYGQAYRIAAGNVNSNPELEY
jgi:hypothetical protein